MKKILSLLCVLGLIITLSSPNLCSIGMTNGIKICLYTIFPSFFPFLVITNILVKYDLFKYISVFTYPLFRRLFGVTPNGSFVALTGFTCGYPIGIKTARDMLSTGNISYSEYLYLIKFCNNPSLPFVINYVAYSVLNNRFETWKLMLCIYGSSIITGIIFNLTKNSKYSNASLPTHSFTNTPNNNVFISAFYTIINLSSYVLLFSIAITYIQYIFKDNTLFKAATITLTEITSGLNYLSGLPNLLEYLPLIIIALVSGGVSITAQSLSFLENKAEYNSYFGGKILCITLSLVLYFIT